MKEKKKSKIFMYISMGILFLSIIGSSYAYYKKVIATLSVNTITKGLDYYINYAKGSDITSGTLNSSTDYTGGNSVTITLNKKDNTYNIYGHIYLDVTTVDNKLKNSDALKYIVLDDSNNVIAEGSLKGLDNNVSKMVAGNIPLSIGPKTYTIYLWLDDNSINDYYIEGETISANVRCEATMKKIQIPTNAATLIRNLYDYEDLVKATDPNAIQEYGKTIKTNVQNGAEDSEITYHYATNVSLMADRLGGTEPDLDSGNIRYYGADPNNYIYFNCYDYSNQNDTNCELCRIIGVFDNKIKIIRKDSIGNFSQNGLNNNWTEARSMKLLNPGYEDFSYIDDNGDEILYNNSLYWNSQSGTCWNQSAISCDFTKTGLHNDLTKSLIATVTWYLGGYGAQASAGNTLYSNDIYYYERSDNVKAGNPTTWDGKIGLMYPSDAGYAADFRSCKNKLGYYGDATCKNYDYMLGYWIWAITPDTSHSAWGSTNGYNITAHCCGTDASGMIKPTLYLEDWIRIREGNGSSTNPYQLDIFGN